MARVEAEAELRVPVQPVVDGRELVDGAPHRVPGACRVLQEEPGRPLTFGERGLERRGGSLEPCLEARAEVGADVEDDAVGFDRARDGDGVEQRVARFLPQRVVRRPQVDEVERVADDRPDLLLLAPLAEAHDVLHGVVRGTPGTRALREDLDGLAAALDRPVDRRVDPSAGGDMGAGQHRAIVTSYPRPVLPQTSNPIASASRSASASFLAYAFAESSAVSPRSSAAMTARSSSIASSFTSRKSSTRGRRASGA